MNEIMALVNEQKSAKLTMESRILELEKEVKALRILIDEVTDYIAKNDFFYLDDHK